KGSPVVGKPLRIEILDKLGGRQVNAAAVDGHVAIVIVERSHLKDAAASRLAFHGHLFMLAILKNGPSLAREQCGEGIELIEGVGQIAASGRTSEIGSDGITWDATIG